MRKFGSNSSCVLALSLSFTLGGCISLRFQFAS